ncbi:hypothetical protein [Nostoc sp.]
MLNCQKGNKIRRVGVARRRHRSLIIPTELSNQQVDGVVAITEQILGLKRAFW